MVPELFTSLRIKETHITQVPVLSYLVVWWADDGDPHPLSALLTPGLPDHGAPPGRADHTLPLASHALTLVPGIVKSLDIPFVTQSTRGKDII